MIHKKILVTIGLALVLTAVISAVPLTQQKVYAQGSPGVGRIGGNGSGNPDSGGNPISFIFGTSDGGSGTKGAPGAGLFSAIGSQSCGHFNCGGGAGTLNSGGSGAGVPTVITGKGGIGGNGVGPGGAP